MAFDLVKMHDTLNVTLAEQAKALPKSFNKDRFVQNCMTVLTSSKDIQACDLNSVKRVLLRGAYLDLDFLAGEAYCIKYGNTATFQTDVKGEKKLVKKYSLRPIKDLYAKLVREGDEFEEIIENGRASINFKPLPFNNGEIIGAFAVVIYEDGGMDYETMSKGEIETIRHNFSKAPNSPAWKNTPGEMYRKTVLRRLCKQIEKDFESAFQKSMYDETSDFDFSDSIKRSVQSDIDENANTIEFDDVIEAEAEVVEDGEIPTFLQDM